MCGIVGAAAQRDVSEILLEGLRRLEYRGYDSAGLAIWSQETGRIDRARRVGKVSELAKVVDQGTVKGHLGIAHTRWATHGKPSEQNAHPHMSHNVAVVHNGIIENFQSLREDLIKKGYVFSSDTDTEVIAHLVHLALQKTANLHQAVIESVSQLEGAYALAVICEDYPGEIIVAREGSPLVIGVGIGEHYIASDQLAISLVCSRFIFLEEGDTASVKQTGINILNRMNEPVERQVVELDAAYDHADKGHYRHFMLKEIHEQPTALRNTLEERISGQSLVDGFLGPDAESILAKVKTIQIVACGTSYHAGLAARYWFESIAKIPCFVEIASEFRYREVAVLPGTLFLTISQSGETADTLAALRDAKDKGYLMSLAICNVPGSSLVRESDYSLLTRAGREIGVASTKAFTTQLAALLLLVLSVHRQQQSYDATMEQRTVKALRALPAAIDRVLTLESDIESLAEFFTDKNHTLFLGRGVNYPIAMEGALKLKELSYIHAEAYAAGELKHGPLALVDVDMPVVAIVPNDELLGKLKANLQEVKARGGQLIVFADENTNIEPEPYIQVMHLPAMDQLISPIVYTLPLQMLAYYVALNKGTDVDQPRNLAKSVTVE